MLARKALAGTAGAPKLYVEDVFSTYLYTGTGATNTISNSIDLSGEGGLVWTKTRGIASDHRLFDTARGALKDLRTNANFGQNTETDTLTSFNSTGFTLGADLGELVNKSSTTYASWTFRKAEKFFDVVTYTGNGSGGRTINHNLGSAPGCIIIKCTSTTSNWMVWHRSISGQDNLRLNTTDSTSGVSTDPISVSGFPSSLSTTQFTVDVGSGSDHCNQNGDTYVAYLFAHDAGGFGDSGSDSIIKCGSFTQSIGGFVDLGWEPQWVLIKRSSGVDDWKLFDNMRGMTMGDDSLINPNTSGAENNSPGNDYLNPQPTGFTTIGFDSGTHIYIAIRRGPMKTPTSGTSVFAPVAWTGTGTNSRKITGAGFAPDMFWENTRTNTNNYWNNYDKLRGAGVALRSYATNAETSATDYGMTTFDMDGHTLGTSDGGTGGYNENTKTAFVHYFKRAPGFFDVVCYTGTGSARTVTHNLGAVPELMIVKARTTATGNNNWVIYASGRGATEGAYFTTAAFQASSDFWNDTTPTSSVFSLGNGNVVNQNTITYVAYLFASLSGVSKIGSYTGNGSSVTVTTNFQPRFILVKRTDSTGDWIVSDSARGLVAGNDPYLELNTTDAEVTNEDWVDITSTSFTVNQTTNNANVNTGTYIYLAIA